MKTILSLNNVSTGYAAPNVIHSINLQLSEGDFTTIIGGNGAGKTTILMTISRFLRLRSGEIYFDGKDISDLKPYELSSLGIAHVPEGRKIFPRLTVQENLDLGGFSRPNSDSIRSALSRIHDLFPILADRADQMAGTLSGGEQQMLAIGRALMGEPRLLLLDEPSMGVAPILVEKIFDTLKRLHGEGITILLVEQNALLAMKLAQTVHVLESGRISISGPSTELIGDPRVKQAYLGG